MKKFSNLQNDYEYCLKKSSSITPLTHSEIEIIKGGRWEIEIILSSTAIYLAYRLGIKKSFQFIGGVMAYAGAAAISSYAMESNLYEGLSKPVKVAIQKAYFCVFFAGEMYIFYEILNCAVNHNIVRLLK